MLVVLFASGGSITGLLHQAVGVAALAVPVGAVLWLTVGTVQAQGVASDRRAS